ncbi:MAG: YqhA family protein [Wenzhouxiangella sp.]|nr:YqhA family protein [Wenzhouxiangella sp.]
MIEKWFKSSRLLVLVTVLVSIIAAILLYAANVYIVANIVIDFVQQVPATPDDGKILAVKFLKVLDMLLIAVTFQIIAVGLFRLFIKPDTCEKSTLLAVLEIRDFHDLKITLIQVAIVILVVMFLEQAGEGGASLETLYYGLAIAVIIASAVFAFKGMEHAGQESARQED